MKYSYNNPKPKKTEQQRCTYERYTPVWENDCVLMVEELADLEPVKFKRFIEKHGLPGNRLDLTNPQLAKEVAYWKMGNYVMDDLDRISSLFGYCDEYIHMKKGRNTIFVASTELAKMIYHANFDVSFDSFRIPCGGIVEFAFPEDAMIEDVPLWGTLFSYFNAEDYMSYLRDFSTGIEDETPFDEHTLHELARRTQPHRLSMKYQMRAHSDKQKELKFHFSLDLRDEDIRDALSSEEQYVKSQNMQLGTQIGQRLNLTESGKIFSREELHRQYVLLRTCVGLCIYMKAFHGVLGNSFPSNFYVQTEKRRTNYFLKEPPNIKMPRLGGKEHWRTWHFRTLRGERFKRDTDGTPRVIFVRDTIVNRRSTPHSLEAENEDA